MLSKYFCYYLPLALHLNKLEFLSLKNALCWVWLKLAKWLRWRKLLNALYIFSIFCYYLHWKRAWPLNSFEETLILSIQGCLYLVWWKLVQWFSKWISMKIKTVNSLQTDNADDRQQGIKKVPWAFTAGELIKNKNM